MSGQQLFLFCCGLLAAGLPFAAAAGFGLARALSRDPSPKNDLRIGATLAGLLAAAGLVLAPLIALARPESPTDSDAGTVALGILTGGPLGALGCVSLAVLFGLLSRRARPTGYGPAPRKASLRLAAAAAPTVALSAALIALLVAHPVPPRPHETALTPPTAPQQQPSMPSSPSTPDSPDSPDSPGSSAMPDSSATPDSPDPGSRATPTPPQTGPPPQAGTPQYSRAAGKAAADQLMADLLAAIGPHERPTAAQLESAGQSRPDVTRTTACPGGKALTRQVVFTGDDVVGAATRAMDLLDQRGYRAEHALGSVMYFPPLPSPIAFAGAGSRADNSGYLRVTTTCLS